MTTLDPPSSDIQDAVLASVRNSLTLSTELSLAPLVTFWNDVIAKKDPIKGAIGRLVQDRLRDAPELLHPIEDLTVLDQHRELVDGLMSAVFPPVFWQQDRGALIPFRLQRLRDSGVRARPPRRQRTSGRLNLDAVKESSGCCTPTR